jgi:hypothetical protein
MQVLFNSDRAVAERMIVHMTQAALYSLDNGITMSAFAEGEYYAVPEYAGRALIERGWARPASHGEVPPAVEMPAAAPPPPKEEASKPARAQAASAPQVETTTYKLKLKGKDDD